MSVGEDKRDYYSRDDVVESYEDWRFGSAGGRLVDKIELDTVLALLRDVDRGGVLLDLPVGTGRMSRALKDRGFAHVVGGDYSPAMLRASRRGDDAQPLVRLDAFHTAIKSASLDVVVCLRFLFHHESPEQILDEHARMLRPGGVLVCDTLRWTPRGLVPPLDRRLGGRVWAHRESRIRRALHDRGFDVVDEARRLALPSLAYRFMPERAVAPWGIVEGLVPGLACSKVFWKARRR